MATGVASAMKRKGGTVIEEDAVRQGPIEVGEAVLTVAGNLAATHVIHAATMGPDVKTDLEKIAAATQVGLASGEKHRLYVHRVSRPRERGGRGLPGAVRRGHAATRS